ncbi:hypothetical protein PENSPDRAFT_645580 [Peniophora sp. CONT]|nr:hypothetical protein PENSPDRAFT_645580 [Peniophora sp. CONT]
MVSHTAQAPTGQTPSLDKAPEATSEATMSPEATRKVPPEAAMGVMPNNNVTVTANESKSRPRPHVRHVAPAARDRDRYEHKKAQLAECAANFERTQRELEKAKRDLRAERGRLQAMAVERDRLRNELSDSNNALEHERRTRAAAEDMLSKRTAELEAANAFLPATETITDTQIMDLVRDLNYEIAQSATTLAEAYENVSRAKTQASQPSVQPEVQATLRLLKLPPNSAIDPTTALQIGLQAALVNSARGFLSHGVYKDARALRPVLDNIKKNEPEYVANKWSALAHQYTRVSAKDHSEQQVLHYMANLLGDALVIAGYDGGQASDRVEGVLKKAGDPLMGMTRLLMQLDVVLGEKVAVGWMESFSFSFGAPFQKEVMDAAYQGDKSTGREKVICSTALGLRRIVKGRTTVLMKPMVALSSLLPVSAQPPGLGPTQKSSTA